MSALLESLKADCIRMLEILGILKAKQLMPNPLNREILYSFAKANIGKDVSPKDQAPDELSCAESLSQVISKAFPKLKFPILLSTMELNAYLQDSPSFQLVPEPLYGDIIISPTGSGNGKIAHGHVGIVGKTWIMSADSRTSFWEANFQLASWRRYYEIRGGFPVLFYRIV